MGNNCCYGSSGKPKSDPPTVPPRPQTLTPPDIVVALYNYEAGDSEEISFNKGDRMEVRDDSDPDWTLVENLVTGKKGYVPSNFVATELTVECEDWFFENTSRKEAEKLLLGDVTQTTGTFLIRPSESNAKNGYSLSVKDWTVDEGYLVKHYIIHTTDTGEYFISNRRKPFDSLAELVVAYSEKNVCGLCHALTNPCKKPEPTMRDLAHAYRKKWEIPRNEIELIESLGEGNFGEVWYGKWKNQIEVAVKTMKETNEKSTKAFLQEGAIMKKFRHKRLVQLYGICSEGKSVYIITEYLPNGNLRDYLRKDQGRTLKMDDLIFIAYQVASGMAHLESLNLIHRDLAARNVLVGENKIIKIGDFGLSRLINDDFYTARGGEFPLKWTAPEALKRNTFSIKSDVWSYGILLMELFTYGKSPYEGESPAVIYHRVLAGRNMEQPSNLPDEIYMIMKFCWSLKPDKRPSFHKLQKYFANMKVIYRRTGTRLQTIITYGSSNSYEDHELNNAI